MPKVSLKQISDEQKDIVQKLAVTKIVRHFKSNSRGQLAMFCGTGKTRTAIKAIKRMKSRVVIVCVPTLGLASQWLKDFAEHGDKRKILAVCGKIHNEMPEDHGIVGATTDKMIVRQFAKQQRKLLIISTYQSYDVIQEAWKRSKLKPIDLLIADEAHNTAGRNGKHMGLCLHDKGAAVEKRLFMTATRRLYRGDKEEINCMDDTDVYGDVVYELTLREAIDRGILADYEVHVINVYKDLTAEQLRDINKKGFESSLLAKFIAQKIMTDDRVKVFSFHNRVDDAKEFAEQVAKCGQWAQCLTGVHKVQYREQVLKQFRDHNGSSLISSAKVLGEGIDSPTVDVVVFADKMTASEAIIQRIGRGTRMSEGKKKLRVVIPVYVSPAMTDSDAIDIANESVHKDVLHVVRAIASQDPVFYRRIAKCKEYNAGKDGNDHFSDDKFVCDDAVLNAMRTRLLPNMPYPEKSVGMEEIEVCVRRVLRNQGVPKSWFTLNQDCPPSFSSWSSAVQFAGMHGKTISQIVIENGSIPRRQKWDVSDEQLINFASQVFGEKLTQTEGYKRLQREFSLRGLRIKDAMLRTNGVRREWSRVEEELKTQIKDVFGSVRPERGDRRLFYLGKWLKEIGSKYTQNTLLDAVYGALQAGSWNGSRGEMLAKAIQMMKDGRMTSKERKALRHALKRDNIDQAKFFEDAGIKQRRSPQMSKSLLHREKMRT